MPDPHALRNQLWVNDVAKQDANSRDMIVKISALIELVSSVMTLNPGEELPPPESSQKRERCPQNFFDPVLTRFVRHYPHVNLRYETTLVGFEEHADRIVATVRDTKSGCEEIIEAS